MKEPVIDYRSAAYHGETLSVNPGVDYINIADFPEGSIVTQFDVINGTLVWESSLF